MPYNCPMETVKRKACRAVFLTFTNEILLIKIANPNGSWTGWITPGGGIDPGENDWQALKRELWEEVGFKPIDDTPPPAIWRRHHEFPWHEKLIQQHETFYLIRTRKFAPSPKADPGDTEMMDFKEIRWWKLEEIAHAQEVFAPRNLHGLIQHIIAKGIPADPPEIG
jgi:8-oxo-dGTP pyrophosphatase MutT (NUDIX family)